MPHNVQSSLLEYLLTDSFILMRNFFRVLDKLWTECWILLLYDFNQMHQAFINHLFFPAIFLLSEMCSPTLTIIIIIIISGRQSDLFFPHVEFSAFVWNLYVL